MGSQVFFATPHHNVAKVDWEKFLQRVLRCSCNAWLKDIRKPNTSEMMTRILRNPESLMEITDEFKPLYRKLYIASFYEENKMEGMDDVVSLPVPAHTL